MKKPQQKLASAILAPGRFHLRCFTHWARADGNLTKYDVCTLAENNRMSKSFIRGQKEINPTFVGLISFWNPATSYSPGSSPTKYHRR